MHTLALRCSYAVWAIFIFVWVVGARRTKQTQFRESLLEAISYRVLSVVGFLFLVCSNRIGGVFAAQIIPPTSAIAWLTIAFSVSGLAICVSARMCLGTNWSSSAVVKKDQELVQSGPYRFVRHPIYSGILLMILADVFLTGQIGGLIAFALFVASFVMKLSREEKLMAGQFPAAYEAYSRRVRRLVPFMY